MIYFTLNIIEYIFFCIIFAVDYKIIYMLKIKEVIKDKGLSVQEVAKRMGISSPALSRAINNNTTVEMLERIAKALDIDIVELFEHRQHANIKCPHCGNDLNIKIE